MNEDVPAEEEVLRMLAAMQPPDTPDFVFTAEHPGILACRRWHKVSAAALLRGLQTDPQFHANGIRFDWLLRLVLAKAEGRLKPTRIDLSRVLNRAFGNAGILRLEDPIEDLFCERISSERGVFRIFSGQWESAGPYTQTLLDAFEALPESEQKKAALTSVYALLRLSDEVARRARVDADTPSGGMPQAEIELPLPDALRQLATRVRSTDAQLAALGILKPALAPYFLELDQCPYVSDRSIGDTPLEFHPLLKTPGGVILVSPANVSTAVRSVLISAAIRGGMGNAFQQAILFRQEQYTNEGAFWPVPLSLSTPNEFFMRVGICEYEQGRYLQVVQIPSLFQEFPVKAFGSMEELSPAAAKFLSSEIEGFCDFVAKRKDVSGAATVILMSGWGRPGWLDPGIDEKKAPSHWQYLAVSFADAGVLGVVPDAKFIDICRVLQQRERLASDGFEFRNMNGILNLFGFWKKTDGNLIPEHMLDVQPPINIVLPTDALLSARAEAVRLRDRRALPFTNGEAKVVERMAWADSNPQPIYVSVADALAARLSAAVVKGDRIWWLDSGSTPEEARAWRYRTWHAVLQWIEAAGGQLVERYPDKFPVGVRRVCLVLPDSDSFERIATSDARGGLLIDTLAISPTSEGGIVKIAPEWLAFLRARENDAEVALAAAVFRCLAQSSDGPSASELGTAVLQAVGSRDWRWLHAQPAVRAEDQLMAAGLTHDFHAVPYSAHCLVKCGSVWNFRDRSLGVAIDGREPCLEFITRYCDEILRSLISDIHRFDREPVCTMSAGRYQDARAEQSRWRNAIRAMRAIHRSSADESAFERQNQINVVMRAAKIICEIAASEAPLMNARLPSQTELDEMLAKALLIFGNGQLYGWILTELIPAKIRISPAGDILTEREIMDRVVRPGAEWIVRKRHDEAAQGYGAREVAAALEQKPFDPALKEALEAEYRIGVEGLFGLQFALAELAEEHNQPIPVLLRSELALWLARNEHFRGGNALPLLERLTLPSRKGWLDLSLGLRPSDIDLGKFDRPWSLINRPLLALEDAQDPRLAVSPLLVADATLYALSGLMDGSLNERYWLTAEARRHAGAQGKAAGDNFEDELAARLRALRLEVIPRCKLSAVLNQKAPDDLGDIDALAITPDRRRLWVIEAKNLRLCRSAAEAAARMWEYRGDFVTDERGRRRPDKMLRHLRRVDYLRQHKERLSARLKLPDAPEVLGLLVVESPQPMNFHTLKSDPDARCVFLDAIKEFPFSGHQ